MDKLPSTTPTRILLTELVKDAKEKQDDLFTDSLKRFLASADKSQLRYGVDAQGAKVLYLKQGVLEGIKQSVLGQAHGRVTRHFKGEEALRNFLNNAMQNINQGGKVFDFDEGAPEEQLRKALALLPGSRTDGSIMGVSKQHEKVQREEVRKIICDHLLKSDGVQVASLVLDPETKGLREVVIEIPGVGVCQLKNGRWDISEKFREAFPPMLRQYTDKDHNFDMQATGQALLEKINPEIAKSELISMNRKA